jgi:hypothetical protein
VRVIGLTCQRGPGTSPCGKRLLIRGCFHLTDRVPGPSLRRSQPLNDTSRNLTTRSFRPECRVVLQILIKRMGNSASAALPLADFRRPFVGHSIRERDPMKQFTDSVKKFLVSEDGPAAVEYAVMMALIIVVCIGTITCRRHERQHEVRQSQRRPLLKDRAAQLDQFRDLSRS